MVLTTNTLLQRLADRSWHRKTLALAIPMILSNLTVPLTGLVDNAVLGHLDHPNDLAAGAIGATLFTLLLWLMGFLRMSTTGLTAIASGAGQDSEILRILMRAAMLALILGVLLLLLREPIWWLTSYLMTADPEVMTEAEVYFDIRSWALPAVLLRFVLIGWLLARQKAHLTLLILLLTNLLNISLDLYFVLVLDWSIEGVAYASLIADWGGLLFGFWLIRQSLKTIAAQPQLAKLALIQWLPLLHLNKNILIRTLALESVFYSHTAISSGFDTVTLAANALLMSWLLLLSYGLDGFAHAVEVLAGHAFGEKNKSHFKSAILISGFWSFLSAAGYSLFFLCGESWLTGLLTSQATISATVQKYSIYMMIMPLIAVWSYWLDGIFIGITDSVSMRNSMCLAVILGFFPASLLVLWIGNHGLWLAFMIFMLVRMLLLLKPLRALLSQNWSQTTG